MDARTAQQLAEDLLASCNPPPEVEYVVTDVQRLSRTWVVYYQSNQYLQIQRPSDALIGNAPILVSDSGTVSASGTARPVGAAMMAS